jgi:hypothetical protein
MVPAPDQVHAEPRAPTPLSVPFRVIPGLKGVRRKRTRWVLIGVSVLALAVGVELWRMHSANVVSYDTVPVERGAILASVTASGTLNAVVDVQVGSPVILPWRGLLRAVAVPEVESLRRLRRLCLPIADIQIVFSYDACRDTHDSALTSVVLDEQHLTRLLKSRYLEAGIVVNQIEKISREDLKSYSTTWANRLAFGKERIVWRIRASCQTDQELT